MKNLFTGFKNLLTSGDNGDAGKKFIVLGFNGAVGGHQADQHRQWAAQANDAENVFGFHPSFKRIDFKDPAVQELLYASGMHEVIGSGCTQATMAKIKPWGKEASVSYPGLYLDEKGQYYAAVQLVGDDLYATSRLLTDKLTLQTHGTFTGELPQEMKDLAKTAVRNADYTLEIKGETRQTALVAIPLSQLRPDDFGAAVSMLIGVTAEAVKNQNMKPSNTLIDNTRENPTVFYACPSLPASLKRLTDGIKDNKPNQLMTREHNG